MGIYFFYEIIKIGFVFHEFGKYALNGQLAIHDLSYRYGAQKNDTI